MADISKIQLSDDTQYNLKDAVARSLLTENDTSTGDISKIQLSDNTQYNIKDAVARQDIETVTTDVKAQVNADKDLINGGDNFIDDETLDDYDDKIEEMQEAYKKFIPIQTASGTEIQLDNSNNDKVLVDIGLDGNTEQETTTGKNKYNKSIVSWYRNNSDTFTNTTDISNNRIRTSSFAITGNQTYTLSGIPENISFLAVRTYSTEGGAQTNDATLNGNTFTLGENATYIHLLFGGSNFTSNTNTLMANANLQIEIGSSATSYEPYTGRNRFT